MRFVRALIAVGLIVVGAVIFGKMLYYPVRYSLTGLVLGAAMIALGVVRLRALYARVAR